ncbi:MAG TPA: hypothetical protein VIR58_16495 [Acidimicrobiales bacterium]
MSWLPDDFQHPELVELPTGQHLRPIRASDAEIDLPAVMGSRDRLFSIYGEAWGGWPPAAMTLEQDRDDLAHHEREIAAHESFNYALLDAAEAELLGCVYIDPPRDPDVDGEAAVSWWVVDALVGSPVERALDDLVPRWLADSWPFERWRVGV